MHAVKAAAEARIAAIDSILAPGGADQPQLPLAATTAAKGPRATKKRHAKRRGGSANNGLRAAVLDVLKQQGPARAPNIASILDAQGFSNDSTTPLAIRVYNDLWRLSRTGAVEGKDGIFTLKEGTH